MSATNPFTLTPTSAGLSVSIGISGSGKSYGIRKSVAESVCAGMRVIAVDPLREWTSLSPSDARQIADVLAVSVTTRDLKRALAAAKREALVIYQPEMVSTLASDCDAIFAEACQSSDVVGIAVPEAHRIAPPAKALTPFVDEVATAWRHRGVRLWLDTQRLSRLHLSITENARELRLYALAGRRDLEVVDELGGRELVEAVRECARRMLDGEPGYHVSLDIAREPPFDVRR